MSKLIYYKSAKRWNQALPLGNGETAIMAFGGESFERLCVNDATLWSGYPKSYDKNCLDSLNQIRQAVFDDRLKDAHNLAGGLEGDYSQAYMPLGEINIKYSKLSSQGFCRELDLDNALFKVSSSDMSRCGFVSYPDKVAVYHSRCKHNFSAKIKLSSKLKHKNVASGDVVGVCGNAPDYSAPNYLWTKIMPNRYNQGKAMAFAMALKAETDGKVTITSNGLNVNNATFITLYMVTHTGFKGYDNMPCSDRQIVFKQCLDKLDNVKKNYANLLDRHISDYKSLYDRHQLNLGKDNGDVLKMIADLDNPTALVNLLYNYGKYMTIAGSRSGQPLNLQGQWNNSIRPPWSSNLTTNINFEMNYWGASAVNLAPCLQPFFDAVQEICANGIKTAKTNYGARGFACNHNVDIWRKTSPVKGNPSYMFAPLCGAWLANEVYAHKVRLGQGIDQLTKELIVNATLFCLDYLVEHGSYFVTCPSASPEAEFNYNGQKCSLGYASAFEMGIIRQCFANALIIDTPNDVKAKIKEITPKLYPFVCTSTGINEWHADFEITDKGHRHFSPLYGLYPSNLFMGDQFKTEKALAKKLFDYRLSNANSSIGWSGAWAICLAGRLGDKEKAEKLIKGLLQKSIMPNLFGFHPPTYFQIDCNMGFIAGINELLLNDTQENVEFLPACPNFMASGSVKGHMIKGSEVCFKWKDGLIIEITSALPLKVLDKKIAKDVKLVNVCVVGR